MEVEVYYFLVVLLFIVVHTIHGQSARDMIIPWIVFILKKRDFLCCSNCQKINYQKKEIINYTSLPNPSRLKGLQPQH